MDCEYFRGMVFDEYEGVLTLDLTVIGKRNKRLSGDLLLALVESRLEGAAVPSFVEFFFVADGTDIPHPILC